MNHCLRSPGVPSGQKQSSAKALPFLDRAGRPDCKGFTLIELVLVMTILALLATMATPAFSMFQKSSRLQQTAITALSAMNRARAEAQRYRTLVAVHFGDDIAMLSQKPKPGILPAYGEMEISCINCSNGDGCGWLSFYPYAPEFNMANMWDHRNWYPCTSKKKVLTPVPLKFSSGVRIITCAFRRSNGMNIIAFPYYQKSAVGEIKRHCCAYDKRGAAAGYDYQNNFYYALVLDETTGEHLLIQVGVFQSNGRPRILPWRISHVQLPWASAPTALNTSDPLDLIKQIDNYPDAETWRF